MKTIPRLIIPEVYETALSYYEQLKCLTRSVNEIIALLNESISDEVKEKVISLLNDYFVSLTYDESSEKIMFKLSESEVKNENC